MCVDLHREHVLQLSCFIFTAVSISDNLQAPEAFPCRTRYLLPAGSPGCPSTQDVMPVDFSLSPLYLSSGRRTVPASQGCEMAFRRRSQLWASWRALQVSTHHSIGPWRFSGATWPCAVCDTQRFAPLGCYKSRVYDRS